MDRAELKNRFAFHPSRLGRGIEHDAVREQCFELADAFNVRLPESREKDIVITKLEEVMFWANAAIARQRG